MQIEFLDCLRTDFFPVCCLYLFGDVCFIVYQDGPVFELLALSHCKDIIVTMRGQKTVFFGAFYYFTVSELLITLIAIIAVPVTFGLSLPAFMFVIKKSHIDRLIVKGKKVEFNVGFTEFYFKALFHLFMSVITLGLWQLFGYYRDGFQKWEDSKLVFRDGTLGEWKYFRAYAPICCFMISNAISKCLCCCFWGNLENSANKYILRQAILGGYRFKFDEDLSGCSTCGHYVKDECLLSCTFGFWACGCYRKEQAEIYDSLLIEADGGQPMKEIV